MTFYLICGLQGSGKTTLAHKLSKEFNAKVFSYDDIPGAMDMSNSHYLIKEQWVNDMNKELEQGNNVICDGTLLNSYVRKDLLSQIIPCRKELIFKLTPLDICIERNKNRENSIPEDIIHIAFQMLETPSLDEGWDKIYVNKD